MPEEKGISQEKVSDIQLRVVLKPAPPKKQGEQLLPPPNEAMEEVFPADFQR